MARNPRTHVPITPSPHHRHARAAPNHTCPRQSAPNSNTHAAPTLAATVTPRVIFAEAVASGRAVYELDPDGPAASEIEAVTTELLELAQ